jgi:hypothetical protein
MHYVTRRSHLMQKHKVDVTCPDAPFVECLRSHPSIKNSASMFHAPDARIALRDRYIPPDAEILVWRNVSRRTFF